MKNTLLLKLGLFAVIMLVTGGIVNQSHASPIIDDLQIEAEIPPKPSEPCYNNKFEGLIYVLENGYPNARGLNQVEVATSGRPPLGYRRVASLVRPGDELDLEQAKVYLLRLDQDNSCKAVYTDVEVVVGADSVGAYTVVNATSAVGGRDTIKDFGAGSDKID